MVTRNRRAHKDVLDSREGVGQKTLVWRHLRLTTFHLQFGSLSMALELGQVIALRRNGAGIVLTVDGLHVTVVPIGGYNGPPPHRAEVRFDDPAEIFSCGVSFRFPVVRCHQPFPIELAIAKAATVLGRAPASLMARVITALRREKDCRSLETRLHFNDGGPQAIGL